MVVDTDEYHFEFSIKAAERNRLTEDSAHRAIYKKLKLLITETFTIISKLPQEFEQ